MYEVVGQHYVNRGMFEWIHMSGVEAGTASEEASYMSLTDKHNLYFVRQKENQIDKDYQTEFHKTEDYLSENMEELPPPEDNAPEYTRYYDHHKHPHLKYDSEKSYIIRFEGYDEKMSEAWTMPEVFGSFSEYAAAEAWAISQVSKINKYFHYHDDVEVEYEILPVTKPSRPM